MQEQGLRYQLICKKEMEKRSSNSGNTEWPQRPEVFPKLMKPIEAAQYLRLDETGNHTPESAIRTLNYWRSRDVLKGTKYARRLWFLKEELEKFLQNKTEG